MRLDPKFAHDETRDFVSLASGVANEAAWRIIRSTGPDGFGCLIVEPPEGRKKADLSWDDTPPWLDYAEAINEVIVCPGVRALTFSNAFFGCGNLVAVDLSRLSFSQVKRAERAFAGCRAIEVLDLSMLSVSSLVNVDEMFRGCTALVELDLSSWATARIASASNALSGCLNLEKVGLDGWKELPATKLCQSIASARACMVSFGGTERPAAVPLDAIDYGVSGGVSWYMAKIAKSSRFAELVIAPVDGRKGLLPGWTDKNGAPWRKHAERIRRIVVKGAIEAETLFAAFSDCKNLEVASVAGFDTSKAQSIDSVFSGCESLRDIEGLSAWSVSSVRTAVGAFANCRALKQVDVSEWNPRSLKDAASMFAGCTALETVNTGNWSMPELRRTREMFKQCRALRSAGVSSWLLPGECDTESMFEGCRSLEAHVPCPLTFDTRIPLEAPTWSNGITPLAAGISGGVSWHITGEKSPRLAGCLVIEPFKSKNGRMGCWERRESVPWHGFRDSIKALLVAPGVSAQTLLSAFMGCENLVFADVEGLSTSSVRDMSDLFLGCSKLQKVAGLSSWDVSQVRNAAFAFMNCSSLEVLDVGSWDLNRAERLRSMFKGCENLRIAETSHWNVSPKCDTKSIFYGCSSLASRVLPALLSGSDLPFISPSWRREIEDLPCGSGWPNDAFCASGDSFMPGEKVSFGGSLRKGGLPKEMQWTVLSSSQDGTLLISDEIVGAVPRDALSTGQSLSRWEAEIGAEFADTMLWRVGKAHTCRVATVFLPRTSFVLRHSDVFSLGSKPLSSVKGELGLGGAKNPLWWLCCAKNELTGELEPYYVEGNDNVRKPDLVRSRSGKVGYRLFARVFGFDKSSQWKEHSQKSLIAGTVLDDLFVGAEVVLGEYIQDGDCYEPITWIVADMTHDKALLVSKHVLESVEHASAHDGVEKWLGERFFAEAFCMRPTNGGLLVNHAYNGEMLNASKEYGLSFLLTEADYRQYGSLINGVPRATKRAIENGVRASESGICGWLLHGKRCVGNGMGVDALGIRPAIQVSLTTGEITPRVFPEAYDAQLSFPYRGGSGSFSFDAGESILFQAGYNVNAREGIPEAKRHEILHGVIEDGLMTRGDCIRLLKRNIALRRTNPSMGNAIAKWQADINYLGQLWGNGTKIGLPSRSTKPATGNRHQRPPSTRPVRTDGKIELSARARERSMDVRLPYSVMADPNWCFDEEDEAPRKFGEYDDRDLGYLYDEYIFAEAERGGRSDDRYPLSDLERYYDDFDPFANDESEY